jgi:outer membrane receptor protein involved in Fe transport
MNRLSHMSAQARSRRAAGWQGWVGVLALAVGFADGWADNASVDKTVGSSPQAAPVAAGQTVGAELKKLSLEELMRVPVSTGTLIPTTEQKTPVAMTVITAEDIRLTPHRHLLDLMEVYVPGAMQFTHSDGAKLGLRGIVSDRNVKFLLLVNGRNINQTAHSGAAAELTNFDLNDVQRVEVIRGPGSVTYGPGAIAGVVNIITKTADDVQKAEFSAKYFTQYDSKILAVSKGFVTDHVKGFMYFSVAATDGVDEPRAYSMERSGITTLNKAYGYVGTADFTPGLNRANPPHPYYQDFDDFPQMKGQVDFKFFDEVRFWGRYTSSGGTVDYRDGLARYQKGLNGATPIYGPLEVFKEIQTRNATAQLEDSHEFTSWFTLDSAVGWSSQDYERRNLAPITYTAATAPPLTIQQQLGDPGSVRNMVQNFAEDQVFARLMGRFEITDETKLAVGGEYVRSHFGPGWFDNPKDFRMGETGAAGIPNIVSGPDSRAINPTGVAGFRGLTPAQAIFVGDDGWWTDLFSTMGELKFEQIPWFNVILSGRMDYHRDADYLFSPRVAIVSEVSENNFLKLTAEQSVRMGTGEQLLASHVNGQRNHPEKLNSIELSYDTLVTDNLRLTAGVFYDELSVVGWSNPQQRTVSLGEQQHGGLEIEAKYFTKTFDVGLNHSFVKLLDWKLASGATQSGVSFADYGVTARDSANVAHLMSGSGNDLANWANNATKAWVNWRFWKGFTFHADARVFWGMDGAKDQLDMVQRAAAGSVDQAMVNTAIQDLRDRDVWGIDFRTNVSITYDLKDWWSVSVFCQNLIGYGNNKRYDYDTGTSTLAPRVFFVEEPRVIGVLSSLRF